MKKRSLLIALTACVAIAASLALGACSGKPAEGPTPGNDGGASSEIKLLNPGKITVAASLDFPPFENVDPKTEKPIGFDIDIMQALCDELGYEMNFLPTMKFDTLVPAVASGTKIDCSISGLTITPERLEEVDFTNPYMDSNQSIAVMKGSGFTPIKKPEEIKQLEGKKIGAQSGTSGYDWAVEHVKGAEVVPFDEATAAFAALQAGKVDAVCMDLPVVQNIIKNSYQNATIIYEIPTGEQYGIAVNKNNPALTKALNEALAKIKANGTYDKILDKWFAVS